MQTGGGLGGSLHRLYRPRAGWDPVPSYHTVSLAQLSESILVKVRPSTLAVPVVAAKLCVHALFIQ